MHPEKKLWLHFLPVLTAAVVITLLSMITSVGIPYITDSFGLTSRQAPWINTAGTMASAILAPLLAPNRHSLCGGVQPYLRLYRQLFDFLSGTLSWRDQSRRRASRGNEVYLAPIPGRKKGGRICRAGGVHLYWLGAWTGNRRASALKNCVEKSLSSQ